MFRLAISIGIAAIALVLSGCDVQFRPGLLRSAYSPGFFQIPAKMDLVMFQDNTGSWIQAMNQVQAAMPQFLDDLESGGWDYRFAAGLLVPQPAPTPFTMSSLLASYTRPLNQVMTSKFDPNWGSQWQEPFPGATLQNTQGVSSSLFKFPWQFTHFVQTANINNALTANEPGFATIDRTLSISPGVLRPDALTVILVIGNGNDTSGLPSNNYLMQMVDRGDGQMIPAPGEDISTFNYYRQRFESLVTSGQTAGVKFYSAVAKQTNLTALQNCIFSYARYSDRYIRMSQAFNTPSFDICSGPQAITSLFADLKSQLQQTRMAFVSEYVMLDSEPNPATLQVIRYPGGNTAQGQIVPESETSGYEYVGQQTVHLISAPVQLNLTTGFAIRLSGDYLLRGDDQIEVFYKPVGTQ